MDDKKRKKAINDLEKYIWTQKGKCDGIAPINKGLITQYCRFAVLADECSLEISLRVNSMQPEELEQNLKNYEKFNKIQLQLYKSLKFEQIKDELADFGNPFTKLFMEAENDGDI